MRGGGSAVQAFNYFHRCFSANKIKEWGVESGAHLWDRALPVQFGFRTKVRRREGERSVYRRTTALEDGW